jgi:predicted enzyme related to lactoylglutathione lyase
MAPRIAHITLDCTNVDVVSQFWSATLERPIEPGDASTFCYVGAAGDPYRLCVMKTPDTKTAKNRMHFDLEASDREAEVKRLLALGAGIVAEYDEGGSQWMTLHDVEGNEFCVF